MKSLKLFLFHIIVFSVFVFNKPLAQGLDFYESKVIKSVQNCPVNLTITTQSEINNFVNRWPGCSEIAGTLTIGVPFGASDITHLTGLQSIKEVGGSLNIFFNPLLVDLNGLSNLVTVGGVLQIRDNQALRSTSGLQKLNSIGNSVWIETNANLLDLKGLSNINIIHGSLIIRENDQLVNLNGLENLSSVVKEFAISGNDRFGSFLGLNKLQTVGLLTITQNNSLENLSGLENLKLIHSSLNVSSNEILRTLEGIDSLQTIGSQVNSDLSLGRVVITQNSKISDLKALSGIKYLNSGLEIIENKSLKYLDGLNNIEYVGGELRISDNDSLLNLNSLNKLRKVGFLDSFTNWFIISQNESLEDISGLSSLDSLNGEFHLFLNPMLKSLHGLENLVYVGGDFEVQSMKSLKNFNGVTKSQLQVKGGLNVTNNDSLVTLMGIEALRNLGGSLSIRDNPMLEDLKGLDSLESLSFQLSIMGNDSLKTIASLKSLKNLNGASISIRNNNSLSSLVGLDSMDPSTISQIIVSRNPKLSMCSVPGICSFLNLPKFAQFNDNAPDCNSRQEVKDICEFQCEVSVVITSPKDTLCAGEVVILSVVVSEAAGDVSYIWNTGDTTETIQVALQNSGMYVVTVTDSKDCTATASKWIEVVSEPDFAIIVSPTTCGENNGSAELLHDGGSYQYLWDNGSTDIKAVSLPPGPIGVRITDVYGCAYEEAAFIEGSEPLEVQIVGDLSICEDEVGQLSVTDIYDTYTWSDGSSDRDAQYTVSGSYSVTVTSDVCTAEDSVQVVVHSRPEVSIMAGDTTLTVMITMGTAPYYIEWNTGDTTSTIVPQTSGTYTVTVTDVHDCYSVADQDFIISHTIEIPYMDVTLYPNPASNQIVLNLAGQAGVQPVSITDISGREVFKTIMEGTELTVDISAWSPGAYVLNIHGKDNRGIMFMKF